VKLLLETGSSNCNPQSGGSNGNSQTGTCVCAGVQNIYNVVLY